MKLKRNLELRLAAERLAAACNRSLGLGTADQPAQLAYIAALEDSARAAPVPSPPSAGVSAAEKAAVLGELSAEDVADGWIAHHGGPMPKDACQVRFRGGSVGKYAGKDLPNYRWNHIGNAADITAYRLAKPAQPLADPYQHLRDALRAGRQIEIGGPVNWSSFDCEADYSFTCDPSSFRIKPEGATS